MKCPKCGYEEIWRGVVIERSCPCIACGFDMDGVSFYSEANSLHETKQGQEAGG